ncbi:unnamed protein product [Cylicocyclus nassatus]|uniref:Uncharacterized protein n=1 Tax=Cylicocyclus nassatus TaxID=53992 RepID=A0AA36M5N1_CYLNA|nr:unnamed protein product [Cylicocyclus nassatus]
MENFRSHLEKCDVVREHLDEWYSGRIRVEGELSKLAWHFEKWGQESESRTAADSTVKRPKNSGAKEGNITKWMDFVVGLMENDRILSDKLFNSVTELQTNEAVLSFKIQCGIFGGESHNSPTESRPRNSARGNDYSRENVEFLLRQKVKTPLLLSAIGTLAISVPWHLEVVKRIKDVACADRRSRCETAKLLHVFAASAKIQREEVRSSIMEYLED